jgi:hypothetical protein
MARKMGVKNREDGAEKLKDKGRQRGRAWCVVVVWWK